MTDAEAGLPVPPSEHKVLVQVRLPERLVMDIDHLAIEWGVYRKDAVERLLRQAMPEARRELAEKGAG
jgi:hypothetical protein